MYCVQNTTFAQDFTIEDNYQKDLSEFNLKKAAYQKNNTLSLKEELRLSLYNFLETRNIYVKNYLEKVKAKSQKELYSKIDPEIEWFNNRKNSYTTNNTLEDLLNKSKEEDEKFQTTTLPIVYFSLSNISLNSVKNLKESHIKIYNDLKNESSELVKLGRADDKLFDRWFRDIDGELNTLSDIESKVNSQIEKILNNDDYQRSSAYKKANDELEPSKTSLLRLNEYIKELENVLESKR